MSWKRWKRGLIVAVLTGIGGGLVGLVIGLTWEQIGILFAANIGKDVLLYISSNPTTIIQETSFLKKP